MVAGLYGTVLQSEIRITSHICYRILVIRSELHNNLCTIRYIITHEVLTLTCALVWRVRTLYWKGLCLRSLYPPRPPRRCPRRLLGSLAPPSSLPAPCASVTTPPAAAAAEHKTHIIVIMAPELHLLGHTSTESCVCYQKHSTLLEPVLELLLLLLSCCLE